MRTGHLVERAEILIALDLLFQDNTRWYSHGELVEECKLMMGYTPHDDCVRLVAKEMVRNAKAECAVKNGDFFYRTPTALYSPSMVRVRARKR